VANRWFSARRGLALGILNSAHSTGQLIFLPLLMFVNVAAGWRVGSLVLLTVVLCLVPLVALWMRDDPSQVGVEPYGSAPATSHRGQHSSSTQGTVAVSFSEALKTSSFWLLAGSFFVCGGTSAGLIATHLIPHAIERGIPEVAAAATIGVMGGMNFVGTLLSGWLTDRVNVRKLLATVYALRGVSLFVLPFVNDLQGLTIFAIIYGLDWFASVPPTIVLTADSFGRKTLGSIYGWIFLSHQLGGAVAAITAGFVYEWFGDYQAAFLGGGVLALAGSVMALMIPSRSPAEPVAAREPAVA
jgi:sugar phosphate permease